jgi:protein TonB
VRTSVLVAASLVLHASGFAAISRKAKQIQKKQSLIAMVEQKKKEEEKKKEPPPKPTLAPEEVLRPKSAPPPTPAPAPEPVANDQPSAAMQALPDFGLNMAGGSGGSLAVPEGKPGAGAGVQPAGSAKPAEKALGAAKPAGQDPALADEIAAWKPKPKVRVKPVYPDEARSAEIEGTVVVEVAIDCTGKVTSAKVLQPLGHGLDQAALTAIQKTEFEPAPRCAPGLSKSLKINYAFRLGD